jgi:hypothetical protein
MAPDENAFEGCHGEALFKILQQYADAPRECAARQARDRLTVKAHDAGLRRAQSCERMQGERLA